MEDHLPQDIIVNHILPRVPAKSVCRFKCVSKEWYSFLGSDMFQNKHNRLHVDDHKNNFNLLILSKIETAFEFTTINCEVPPSDHKGLSLTRRPLPPFEGITTGNICILVSGHGLVCLGIHDINNFCVYSDIILWNPLTNEYRRLPKFTSHNIWYSDSDFGLYYSCCEDDYKLLFVNFIDKDVYIYSLKSDSWRKIDVFQHISLLSPGGWSGGTYLNGNIYFLQEENLNERLSSIIRFGTKNERLSKIEIPDVDDDPNPCNYFATIMVKSDCIHVCVKYDINMSCDTGIGSTTRIKLWKLDEYGKMIEVVNYQLRTRVYDIPISYLIPFHLMKNGKWLMRSYENHQIYIVDLKKKMHIKDKGEGKEKDNIYDDFEYAEVRVDHDTIVDQEVRYIETFVSPNPYTK